MLGCSSAVTDARGNVIEDTVVFTVEGTPHCPFCNAIVERYSNYCPTCKESFRWVSKKVPCWRCGGRKTCPVCKGSGTGEHSRWCYFCYDPKVDRGTGYCQECDDDGFVTYGESINR